MKTKFLLPLVFLSVAILAASGTAKAQVTNFRNDAVRAEDRQQSKDTNLDLSASSSDWRRSLDEIVRDIRAYHPDPFTKIGKLAFSRELERLEDSIPALTEEQRVVGAMRLVALIGDGHTHLEPDNPRFAYWYPIRLLEFGDGYFVTSVHSSVRELAGSQILYIAGRPVAEVANRARELLSADNAFQRKERLYALHNAALMKGLGYASANGQLAIKAKLRDGSIVERILTPHLADDPSYKGLESRFEWQYRGEMFGMPFGNEDEWISAYQGLSAGA